MQKVNFLFSDGKSHLTLTYSSLINKKNLADTDNTIPTDTYYLDG